MMNYSFSVACDKNCAIKYYGKNTDSKDEDLVLNAAVYCNSE